MKKLFFFRASANNGGGSDGSPPLSENSHWEVPVENGVNSHNAACSPRGIFSKSRKQVCDSQSSSNDSGLRRSRSFSSAEFPINGLDQKKFSAASNCSGSPSNASSGNSSYSNTSSKVVDRYIDGEQQQERSKKKKSSSQRYFAGNNNCGGRLPPQFQRTVAASPADVTSDNPRSQSFREHEKACCHFSSRDWAENEFDNGSPCRLAKSVIERLSETHISKSSPKEFGHDVPITIEDIYGGPVERCYDVDLEIPLQNTSSLEESHRVIKDCRGHATFASQKQKMFKASFGGLGSLQNEDTEDLELQRRSKEVEERIVLLSKEFEQQSFLQGGSLDVPLLMNIIRDMAQDKISLAIEVSGLLNSCIAERDCRKEELRLAKEESDSRCWKLEKEKNELQSALEKELDRRSKDWSLKLEKYQLEEQRLRERVRELAEQNVFLQREISSSSVRETENRSMMICSEQQISRLESRIGELSEENKKLKQELCELQEKHAAVEENLDCMKKNYEGENKECKEQQKFITRMLRTCSEQQKTIDGLLNRFGEEIDKGQSSNEFDGQWVKLEMEQTRLAGVELALRREVESQRLEVESLRHENIHLLKRLKANGQDLGASTLKLDKEIWTRVHCLQNQGITMLNESVDLCSKLLEHMKEKAGQMSDSKQGASLLSKGLDGRFVVESVMKIQGFKRGTESLARSLQTTSSLLQDKCDLVASNSRPPSTSYEGSVMINQNTSVETVKSELKAEILLTSLLREKLYSKELEVEQLQAELTAAARGNDILQSEVQNALDDLSCFSHKLKDAELQMRKKDENISRLQSELQESVKEHTILKGILAKISQERDLMWEEVKQYNEKNMLLNSEVNTLKKKIETLDEDILLKEGQITILKDTLGNKPFDLLSSPDTQEFLLR